MTDLLEGPAAGGEITVLTAATEIADLMQGVRFDGDFHRLCAQIQGAVFANEVENRNGLAGEWLVENVCPSEPSLLAG